MNTQRIFGMVVLALLVVALPVSASQASEKFYGPRTGGAASMVGKCARPPCLLSERTLGRGGSAVEQALRERRLCQAEFQLEAQQLRVNLLKNEQLNSMARALQFSDWYVANKKRCR